MSIQLIKNRLTVVYPITPDHYNDIVIKCKDGNIVTNLAHISDTLGINHIDCLAYYKLTSVITFINFTYPDSKKQLIHDNDIPSIIFDLIDLIDIYNPNLRYLAVDLIKEYILSNNVDKKYLLVILKICYSDTNYLKNIDKDKDIQIQLYKHLSIGDTTNLDIGRFLCYTQTYINSLKVEIEKYTKSL